MWLLILYVAYSLCTIHSRDGQTDGRTDIADVTIGRLNRLKAYCDRPENFEHTAKLNAVSSPQSQVPALDQTEDIGDCPSVVLTQLNWNYICHAYSQIICSVITLTFETDCTGL